MTHAKTHHKGVPRRATTRTVPNDVAPSSLLALKVAAALFMLFSVGHLVRLLAHVNVSVAGRAVPLWVSLFGALIGAGLAVWMWWAAHPRKPPAETP